ncbi:MAG: hypothetical protein ACXVPU_04205 [Bacteroidia bacterium]
MKKIPRGILLVTLFNFVELLTVIYILLKYPSPTWLTIILLVEMIFVVVANYFLIKGHKLAWKAFLIWYILLTFSFDNPLFSWGLSFGLNVTTTFSLRAGTTELQFGLDFLALAILFILLLSKKNYMNSLKKEELNENDFTF